MRIILTVKQTQTHTCISDRLLYKLQPPRGSPKAILSAIAPPTSLRHRLSRPVTLIPSHTPSHILPLIPSHALSHILPLIPSHTLSHILPASGSLSFLEGTTWHAFTTHAARSRHTSGTHAAHLCLTSLSHSLVVNPLASLLTARSLSHSPHRGMHRAQVKVVMASAGHLACFHHPSTHLRE